MSILLFLTLCPFLSLLLIPQSFLEGLSRDRNLRTDQEYGHSPCLSFLYRGEAQCAWLRSGPSLLPRERLSRLYG